MPSLNSATAPYTLRSCFGKEPLVVVKGVDDDITEKWKRLDEKYGDPTKEADAIIDSVQRVKTIKEGDDKRFIEFVEIVDSGYRDLLRIRFEKEITTTSSVSIIVKKLPPNIRRDWAKLVSSDTSSVDKKDKFQRSFPVFLNFYSIRREPLSTIPQISGNQLNNLSTTLMQWSKKSARTTSKAGYQIPGVCSTITLNTRLVNAGCTSPKLGKNG